MSHHDASLNAIDRRIFFSFFRYATLAWALLTFLLVTGQCFQFRDFLIGLSAVEWLDLLVSASLVMTEATVPLAILFSTWWLFAQLREQNIAIVLAIGGRGLLSLMMFPLIGVICTTIAFIPIVNEVSPRQIAQVAALVRTGAVTSMLNQPQTLDGIHLVSYGNSAQEGSTRWFFGKRNVPPYDAIIRVDDVRTHWSEIGPRVSFGPAMFWDGVMTIRVRRGAVVLDQEFIDRKLNALTGPNSVASSKLDDRLLHHRFVKLRRTSMLLVTPIWCVLGLLCGLAYGRLRGLAVCGAAVGVAYWILRKGSCLRERAISPPSGRPGYQSCVCVSS